MINKTFKLGLAGALLSLLLVGCSTTDTTETQPVQDTTITDEGAATRTGAEGADGMTAEDTKVDPLEGVDTVFYFDFDKSMLKPEARAALTIHAEVLRESPRNIRLLGHADERGTREYNLALGERRANSVRDFLVLQGVDASYIEVISYGEERPAVEGSNEESWALNRRVELK